MIFLNESQSGLYTRQIKAFKIRSKLEVNEIIVQWRKWPGKIGQFEMLALKVAKVGLRREVCVCAA